MAGQQRGGQRERGNAVVIEQQRGRSSARERSVIKRGGVLKGKKGYFVNDVYDDDVDVYMCQ